jgi:hypothetical protein
MYCFNNKIILNETTGPLLLFAIAMRVNCYFCRAFWVGIRSRPVSRVLSGTVIHLGHVSPHASCDLPESSAGRTIGFLFGLAPGGVYHRRKLLPVARCALTAPFHPYRTTRWRGGFLSVALSVGSRPPGVTWRPALWSPDFPPRPAGQHRMS